VVEALFWPALLGYGEAAFAYATVRTSRAATWGVRLGWLAQTGLLIAQAARADGFPWSTWAGSLNLFVWFVVGAYLIWGCRPRFHLLGLSVMPLALALFVVARLGGGTATSSWSCTSALRWQRSQGSPSRPVLRGCTCGRRGA
jgi:ABC-type transport system involved in cytochrome c biogenesis permease subunit